MINLECFKITGGFLWLVLELFFHASLCRSCPILLLFFLSSFGNIFLRLLFKCVPLTATFAGPTPSPYPHLSWNFPQLARPTDQRHSISWEFIWWNVRTHTWAGSETLNPLKCVCSWSTVYHFPFCNSLWTKIKYKSETGVFLPHVYFIWHSQCHVEIIKHNQLATQKKSSHPNVILKTCCNNVSLA